MQRKLTEIAEIPKILSSTLATVSQTFDKLLPNVGGGGIDGGVELNSSSQAEHKPEQLRKFSYDEDAVDYALNVGADDDDDDFDENGEHVGESVDDDDDNDRYDDAASTLSDNADNDEIERDLHKLKSKLRDLTPESDYASSESDNDDNEYDDDDENYADAASVHANASEIDDFLTTSLTWRMRKVPKIFLNGQPNECTTDSSADDEDDDQDDDDDDEEQLTTVRLPAPKMPQNENKQQPQNQEKRTPLELAWPWADSRKIIYKQSTCHLVPRKCGIIERSKQLLAQRNLFDFNQYHKLEQPQLQQQQQHK